MKVVWSPLAELRALEAVEYIAEDRPLAAAKWLEGLLERVAKLDQFERRGRVVWEIGNPAYREILFEPYRIIYRIDQSSGLRTRTSLQTSTWILHRTPSTTQQPARCDRPESHGISYRR